MQLLASITGSQKISLPTTIVVSGIVKMFVGELVETGKSRVIILFTLLLIEHYHQSTYDFDVCSSLKANHSYD